MWLAISYREDGLKVKELHVKKIGLLPAKDLISRPRRESHFSPVLSMIVDSRNKMMPFDDWASEYES
jgi:hypothetical protein